MIVDLLEEKKVLENRIGENNISPRGILPGPRYFEVVVVDNWRYMHIFVRTPSMKYHFLAATIAHNNTTALRVWSSSCIQRAHGQRAEQRRDVCPAGPIRLKGLRQVGLAVGEEAGRGASEWHIDEDSSTPLNDLQQVPALLNQNTELYKQQKHLIPGITPGLLLRIF